MSKAKEPKGLSEHVDAVLRMAGETAEIRFSIAMTGSAPRKIEPYGMLAPYIESAKSKAEPDTQEV